MGVCMSAGFTYGWVNVYGSVLYVGMAHCMGVCVCGTVVVWVVCSQLEVLLPGWCLLTTAPIT